MDLAVWKVLAIGAICVAASAMAAYSDSKVVIAALDNMARQPEMQPKLFTAMLIGIGLVESIPIISIVIAFMLLGGLGH